MVNVFSLNVTDLQGSEIFLRYYNPNTEVVNVEWIEGTTTLKITALTEGEAEVTISLYNKETGEIYDEKTINIRTVELKIVLDKKEVNINYKKTTLRNLVSVIIYRLCTEEGAP